MSTKTSDRAILLGELEGVVRGTHAEFDSAESFARAFCPIAEHIRSLDPEIAIVLGDRGSGKTELFRASETGDIRRRLIRFAPAGRTAANISKSQAWVTGYSGGGTEFPDARSLRSFFRERGTDPDNLVDFWYAYLVRSLREHIVELDPERATSIRPLFEADGAEINSVLAAFSASSKDITPLLDSLDRAILANDRYIVVSYDALDAFGGADREVMRRAISGLLSLWAQYVRRWSRIRPKVFLRPDIFRDFGGRLGADFAKLASLRTELRWTDSYLYTMLVKRLLNAGPALERHIGKSSLRDLVDDPVLGRVPNPLTAEAARSIIEKIASPFMGANVKKGLTYTWVVDHIRDGNRRALPRAFVQLFGYAAQHQLESGRVGQKLLDWTSIRRAIDTVSIQEVQQASDEWPWLEGLRDRLKGAEVPIVRRRFERLLDYNFASSWGNVAGGLPVEPPADSARDMMDFLLQLGVARTRPMDRVDIPDLYAEGLGVKRRGGVAKQYA